MRCLLAACLRRAVLLCCKLELSVILRTVTNCNVSLSPSTSLSLSLFSRLSVNVSLTLLLALAGLSALSLPGPIPEAIGELSSLTSINLAGNKLTGKSIHWLGSLVTSQLSLKLEFGTVGSIDISLDLSVSLSVRFAE